MYVFQNKRTALYYAKQYGYDSTVKLLLERGADTQALDQVKCIALRAAARDENIERVKSLLKDIKDVNDSDENVRIFLLFVVCLCILLLCTVYASLYVHETLGWGDCPTQSF